MISIRKNEMCALFILVVVPLFLHLSSAEIILSDLEPSYNFGDEFNLSVKIIPPRDLAGFLAINFICPGSDKEFYLNPLSLQKGREKEIFVATTLGSFIANQTEGSCFISAAFDSETARSREFELTSKLAVYLNINGLVFSPEDKVAVYGDVMKVRGVLKEGLVEMQIPQRNLSFPGIIKDGKFRFNFTLPSDIAQGNYELKAAAYERDNSARRINEGSASSQIKIRSVLKGLSIAVSATEVSPGEELSYTILVYDQSGENIPVDTTLSIYSPAENLVLKKIARSGEAESFAIASNYTPGSWKIEATSDKSRAEKTFLVGELKQVSFKLQGQTLTITNTGNVPYTNPIEISIGEVSEIKEVVALPVGGSKNFRLAAPDGSYNIEVGDSGERQNLGTAFLTGNAISIEDINRTLNENLLMLLWILLIIVLLALAVLVYRRARRRKLFGKPSIQSEKSGPAALDGDEKQSSIIDKGEKQEAEIIALKTKNQGALSEGTETLKAIDSALWKAKEAGAKIYSDNEYRIIVFTPSLTKVKDNSVRSVIVAQSIWRILNEYNKRHAVKISFGIAAHSGELIVEKKEGKFRFMSVNNAIASTKRLAAQSDSELIISESLHRKTAGKVKVSKIDENIWKVEKVVDRSEYKDFIRNFSARNKFR